MPRGAGIILATSHNELSTKARRPTAATPRQRLVGVLLMIPAMILWLVVEAVASNIEGQSAFQIVWTRYLVHIVILVLLVTPRGGLRVFRTHRLGFHLLRSMMMLIMPASFVLGSQWNSVPDLMALFWFAPIWVAVISYFLLKERGSVTFWILLAIGVAATTLIMGPDLGMLNPKDVLGLTMGLSFAAYLPMTRALSTTEFIETKLFYSAFGVFAVLTLFLPFFFKWPSLAGFIQMAVIGAMGLVVLYLIEKALTLCDATSLAPLLFVQPLVATALRLAQGRRSLETDAIVGLAVLFLAVVAMVWIRLRPKSDDRRPRQSTGAPALSRPAKHA